MSITHSEHCLSIFSHPESKSSGKKSPTYNHPGNNQTDAASCLDGLKTLTCRQTIRMYYACEIARLPPNHWNPHARSIAPTHRMKEFCGGDMEDCQLLVDGLLRADSRETLPAKYRPTISKHRIYRTKNLGSRLVRLIQDYWGI